MCSYPRFNTAERVKRAELPDPKWKRYPSKILGKYGRWFPFFCLLYSCGLRAILFKSVIVKCVWGGGGCEGGLERFTHPPCHILNGHFPLTDIHCALNFPSVIFSDVLACST